MTGAGPSVPLSSSRRFAQALRKRLGSGLVVRDQLHVRSKGIDKPLVLHDVCGLAGTTLAREEDEMLVVEPPLGVRISPLEGKHLTGDRIDGDLLRLSPSRADLRLGQDLEPYTNVRLP